MRTDAHDPARVRDPTIELLLIHATTLTDEWCSRRVRHDVEVPSARHGARTRSVASLLVIAVLAVGLTSCDAGSSSVAPSTSTRRAHVGASSTVTPVSAPATVATATTSTRVPSSGRSYEVVVENRSWRDPSRRRALPTRIFIPARGGTPAVHDGPFPLFVWAHGLDATVGYFDRLLSAIAARGYVVVAPTFPLTNADVPGGADFNDYVNQPADVSFVIGQILAIDGPHGTDRPDLVDPTRIAVGGHSLGAVTTMGLVANACCIDARVKAAIEIDGSRLTFPGGRTVERGVPVLYMHGDADQTFSVNESRAMFAASSRPKYLVVLHGIPHTPFRIPAAYAVIAESVDDFLDAYLKHAPRALSHLLRDGYVAGLASIAATP